MSLGLRWVLLTRQMRWERDKMGWYEVTAAHRSLRTGLECRCRVRLLHWSHRTRSSFHEVMLNDWLTIQVHPHPHFTKLRSINHRGLGNPSLLHSQIRCCVVNSNLLILEPCYSSLSASKPLLPDTITGGNWEHWNEWVHCTSMPMQILANLYIKATLNSINNWHIKSLLTRTV